MHGRCSKISSKIRSFGRGMRAAGGDGRVCAHLAEGDEVDSVEVLEGEFVAEEACKAHDVRVADAVAAADILEEVCERPRLRGGLTGAVALHVLRELPDRLLQEAGQLRFKLEKLLHVLLLEARSGHAFNHLVGP